MQYQFPFTIETKYGEKINFLRMEGERLILEGFCKPMAGPGMHVHLRQDEGVTVISGKIGYQIMGEEPQYGGQGESITFKRGVPHRFWNAGEEELHISGWINPAENVVFFLSTLYEALNRGEGKRPEIFDAAYLTCRYRSEFDTPEIPGFVKKWIMPVAYFIGRLLGKYQKFKQAPQPF
ncbi:MAG: cupin domain-containing protein [Saprospiraceae bacterium]|nr:cupin domain-containing protein [Saprospiraceae bacterium]